MNTDFDIDSILDGAALTPSEPQDVLPQMGGGSDNKDYGGQC